MRHVTIRDVARQSRCSIATVSRVLNNNDYPISDALRERVLCAAADLGYTPNLLAKSLKTNISREVAVVIPTLSNPFHTDVIRGVEERLSDNGYGMSIYVTGKNGYSARQLIGSLQGKLISGVIVVSDSVDEKTLAAIREFSSQNHAPVLLVDYPIASVGEIDGVFYDYIRGGALAAEYLVTKGHRRIAFATGKFDRPSRRLRYLHFKQALAQNGVETSDEDLLMADMDATFEAGLEIARRIVDAPDRPTAVLAVNDTVAVGILCGLAEAGVSVPDELSVMGFDNVVYSKMTYPALTTVNVPAKQMGRLSADKIVEEITGERIPFSIYLEPEIVVRKSVAAVAE